jgi:hypothetical protein
MGGTAAQQAYGRQATINSFLYFFSGTLSWFKAYIALVLA